jgi:aminoglycoside phosphotransferase
MLAPDAGVPQRDALLSERTVARLLGAPVERVYAKYRVGESLRVVYRVGADGHVAARTFRGGASAAAYERALASAVPAGPPAPVIHAPALDAVFWTFPNDRKIAALPLLAPGSPALAALVGRRCAATRLVAYAAERAANAACLDGRGQVVAYVKVHAGDGAARERRALETAAAAGVRVPRVLAAAERALALEPLSGRRLDGLTGRELAAALRALGAALAALHEAAPAGQPRFDRLDPDRLARAVAVIGRARPDAARSAAALLDRAVARRDECRLVPLMGGRDDTRRDNGARSVLLHGDANLRNAILDGNSVGLIDFEDAAAGPAAADLGQLLAGLLAARVLGTISAGAERALAGALLDGYRAVACPPDAGSLRWHTAASVLARVALPAVNRVRVPVLRRLVPLLDAAEATA